MHKHTMKLCSASLEFLYMDIEGIKGVFWKCVLQTCLDWGCCLLGCYAEYWGDISDMLTALQNTTSQKLESSTSAPWKPNVTWLEWVSSCNNARLSCGICKELMLEIRLHSVILQSQPLPWEPQISPRVLPFFQANARIKLYLCMQ